MPRNLRWYVGNADRFSRHVMFAEPIEVWDAVITAVSHKIKDGLVSSRILFTGTLNEDLADALGAKTLVFTSNGTPKEGFSKLELSTGCAACRALFEADPALKQSFELNGDSSDNYVIERQAEGVLRLKARLNYHGDPYQVLGYVLAVGSGESVLKITPLQTELEAEEDTKVEINVPGQQPIQTTMGEMRRATRPNRRSQAVQ